MRGIDFLWQHESSEATERILNFDVDFDDEEFDLPDYSESLTSLKMK